MYDYDDNILHGFYEFSHPFINTLSTFIGEMSIALWDLQSIKGIPIQRSFYDEVIPSVKELTQSNIQGKLFLLKSYLYSFSAFYKLAKGGLHEIPSMIG